MKFELKSQDPKSKARAGIITTDHGVIETPIFMPVGTVGTVKGVHQTELKTEINPDIILGNTYHLYLRPTTKILEEAGGLHKFMNWDRNILTDSGGYQVYSLSGRRKINEEGVKFKSHIDGSMHFFTPENVMEIQRSIGADIIMAFDECPPYPSTYEYAKTSMHMTHRWLDRCFNRINETEPLYGYGQTLFPIIQGSTFEDLRNESAHYIASKNADGNAIGGRSGGEPAEEMYKHAAGACAILPKDKPRYLMGVGTPANILENISLGIDMFDCVMPTRNGRNGQIFTSEGILNLRNKKWENVHEPLDKNGTSFVDNQYTKAYVRHLIHSKESLGAQIASLHNIRFYLWLVEQAREHIIAGDFASWKNHILPKLEQRL